MLLNYGVERKKGIFVLKLQKMTFEIKNFLQVCFSILLTLTFLYFIEMLYLLPISAFVSSTVYFKASQKENEGIHKV